MRAAIYARFSTDKQRDTSIDDQIRVCRARVHAEGWREVCQHADNGVSGSTPVASRPGGQRLLADAVSEQFDVLVVEGLDRLSRDLVEQERIVRRLEHAGLRLVGVSDGYDSTSAARKLHRGMRGLINEVYLDDLRAKTHRGLSGQVERGLHAGGLSYGYRSVEDPGGHRLEIEPDAAQIVRRIFSEYAAGRSITKIVYELNHDRIPSPRGSRWVVSGVYGSPAKGSGILNNELYAGRYVWNRSRWVKDPETGVRKRVERPRSEWRVREEPTLQIVPDELWRTVHARMATPHKDGGTGKSGKVPTTLLGGLMRCGLCGGPVVAISQTTYGCATAKNSGPDVCRGVYVSRSRTETRLLAEIRSTLLAPANLAAIQERVRDHLKDRAKRRRSDETSAARRIQGLEVEIANLTAAIGSMGLSKALSSRLREAEAELAREQAPLAKPPRIGAIPDLIGRYKAMLADLATALRRDPSRARAAIRDMLGVIELVPDGDGVVASLPTAPAALLRVAGLVDNTGSGGRI